MRPRAYRMTTTWRVPSGRDATWGVLADPSLSWPRWWPGMRRLDVRPAADGGLVGSAAAVELRAVRWAYALRFAVRVRDAEPARRVVIDVTGDLDGTGTIRLDDGAATAPGDPGPAGTVVAFDWRVATTRPWMNATGPVLAPVFTAAHGHAMRAGERGLARYLAG